MSHLPSALRLPPSALAQSLFRGRWGYFFLLPSLLPYAVFFVLPLARAVLLSLSNWQPGQWEFVGLAHYADALASPILWTAMRNTAVYTGVVVGAGTLISLALAALILPLRPSLQSFFKGAFYLPTVVSVVVVTTVWAWLYNPAYGLLNYLLGLAGQDPVVWLGDRNVALPALMLMALATGRGPGVIILTASMAGIPTDLYDAGRVDGAGGWALFRHITLPLIRPALLYLILISTLEAFQVFAPMWLLTNGGPQGATLSMALLIYRTAFASFQLGPAAAQSMILFVAILFFSILYFRVLGGQVEY
jgi:multiple sugar transport system permease protein